MLRTAVGPEIDLSAAVSPLAEYRGAVRRRARRRRAVHRRVATARCPSACGWRHSTRTTARSSAAAARARRRRPLRARAVGARRRRGTRRSRPRSRSRVSAGSGCRQPASSPRSSSPATAPHRSPTGSTTAPPRRQVCRRPAGGLEPGDSLRRPRRRAPDAPTSPTIEAPGGVERGRRRAREPARVGRGARLRLGRRGARRPRRRCCASAATSATGCRVRDGDRRRGCAALPDYAFQPSASGPLARPDRRDVRAPARARDRSRAPQASGNYVAAVGDDEQFAVAVALIARELGFPARVVLGARLGAAEPGLAACDEGVCRAQDLSAWTEVQSSDGRLGRRRRDAAVRAVAEPRGDRAARPRGRHRGASGLGRRGAAARPGAGGLRAGRPRRGAAGLDLAWLWPIASHRRRRAARPRPRARSVPRGRRARRRRVAGARRRSGAPAARIAGGWDEYVDAAVDAGREAPRALTRRELAAVVRDVDAGAGSPTTADRAVFSRRRDGEPTPQAFWRVGRRRSAAASLRERGFWRGLAATVSLRSFVRHLAPITGARTRFAERGKRRVVQPARPMP